MKNMVQCAPLQTQDFCSCLIYYYQVMRDIFTGFSSNSEGSASKLLESLGRNVSVLRHERKYYQRKS